MYRTTKRLRWLVAVWMAPQLTAEHAGLDSLHGVLAKADAVVVASGAWYYAPDGSGHLEVTIAEALKGPLRTGEKVTMPWSRDEWGGGVPNPPREPAHGMFFLRKTDRWRPLSFLGSRFESTRQIFQFYFMPRDPLPAEYRLSSAFPIEDRIFVLLAWADSRAPVQVRPDLRQGMLLRNRLDVDFRGNERSAFVAQRLAQLTESSDYRNQANGIRTRIQQGDADTIRKLATEYQRHREDIWGWQRITRSVMVELPPGPGVTAALATLVEPNLSDAPLRLAAAGALARIHDRESLPHLARLLDDRDPEIRAYAVGGLAMFANNVPIGQHHPAPGDWPFRTSATMAHSTMSPASVAREPAKYIGFWKNWWRDNQAAAMAPGR